MSGRDPGEAHRASTPLELLFDLTFVVAVAQAAARLHHALAQGHASHALAGYAVVFFGLWWAWVNFTWFASAYDTDDVPYRLLTLLQMAGVLVKHSAAEEIRQSLPWTFVWALAHYLIFATVAALGAGLQVAIGALTHDTGVTPVFAAFTVAIPVAIFIVVLALLDTRMSGEPAALGLTLLTAALVLAAAATASVLALPLSTVIMVVLVALLLAYHLIGARPTR